ncbi:hypothetical protein [Peristeroidobacter agariperforans]|uniref:hypothetical protein n=1 Tax=Peristeroidobacter agariperforans TaxID=268404 RepID=UPI00101BB7D1|nr:hypothetical protein [Peristeroidobacter agariperforans]
MNRIGPKPALLALLIASTLTGAVGVADPLHKYGDDGAWCHVDSGWVFPKDVGSFARVLQPYNIDGNNDAGAEYEQESATLQGAVEVDVYAADSAATDANIDGARATAALTAGEGAIVESEQPFPIDAVKGLKGVKVMYATDTKAAGGQTNLYYFTTDRWRVKVLAHAKQAGTQSDQALDAFVRALPWNTLGTNPGIH